MRIQQVSPVLLTNRTNSSGQLPNSKYRSLAKNVSFASKSTKAYAAELREFAKSAKRSQLIKEIGVNCDKIKLFDDKIPVASFRELCSRVPGYNLKDIKALDSFFEKLLVAAFKEGTAAKDEPRAINVLKLPHPLKQKISNVLTVVDFPKDVYSIDLIKVGNDGAVSVTKDKITFTLNKIGQDTCEKEIEFKLNGEDRLEFYTSGEYIIKFHENDVIREYTTLGANYMNSHHTYYKKNGEEDVWKTMFLG